MTNLVSIGATVETPETACHSFEAWHAMLDANRRGDLAAVERLLATPPTMIATASLRVIPAAPEGDFSHDYWAHRERHGAPKPARLIVAIEGGQP